MASGTITFETDHFSYYIVSQEMGLGSPDDDGDDDGSNTVMHVGISAAVVAVLVALTFIVIRRKA